MQEYLTKACVCDIQTPLPIQLVIYMNEILKNKAEDERRVCPSFPSVSIRTSFDLCFPGLPLQEQPQLFRWHDWGQGRDE